MRLTPTDEPETPIEVEMDDVELRVLESLPDRMRSLLTDPTEAPEVVDRLFPPAFPDDPEREAEHRKLIGESLFERRLAALNEWENTLERVDPDPLGTLRLSAPEVDLWLHVLNDFRLMFAMRLGVEESGWQDQPAPPGLEMDHALLEFLTWLQQGLVEAVSRG